MQSQITDAPPATQSAATFIEGITDSLPIVIGYLPVAFAFGLSSVKLGFTPWEDLLFLHHLCWSQPICDHRAIERRNVIMGFSTDRDGNGYSPYLVWPRTQTPHFDKTFR